MSAKKLRHALCLLGIAVLLMTVGSMTSPLFPLHTRVDQNCFLTVAEEWLHGKLPYRDLFEQKGPLLYLLHLPAALLPGGGFFGVYLVQIALWVLLLLGMERLTGICLPECTGRRRLCIAAWSALIVVTARCYSRGDNAEEFCLVPVLFGLCDLLRTVKAEKLECPRGLLLRNGIFAGCILWIKFSMLGFFIGWCLVIGILLWRESSFLSAVKAGLWFLLGLALTALPWVLYFGLHGALGDLFHVYVLSNATLYPRSVTMTDRILDFFRSDYYKNPVMMTLLLLGAWYCTKGKQMREKCAVWVTLLLLYVFVFIGGVRYRYYLLILGAYVPFGCIAVSEICRKYVKIKRTTVLRAAQMVLYPAVLLLAGNCLHFIGMPRAEYPQVQFAQQMDAGKVLLNYGFLDGGFWRMSGTLLPEGRFFCQLNIDRAHLPEMFEAQEHTIDERAAEYVVIRKETAERWEDRYTYAPFYQNYEKIAEAEEPYDGYCYALYRLKSDAA